MVQRFKLRHVPCSMKQAGKSLRITEWVEDELVAALEEQNHENLFGSFSFNDFRWNHILVATSC